MNERVLVVEDSAFQRARIRERLEPTFEVVAEAADGEEAVAAYRESDPDAVTMDFSLPGMNGPDATSAIKSVNPDAVVVFCSCVTQREQLKRAIRAGADGYVHKPFDEGELTAAIRSALAASSNDKGEVEGDGEDDDAVAVDGDASGFEAADIEPTAPDTSAE